MTENAIANWSEYQSCS